MPYIQGPNKKVSFLIITGGVGVGKSTLIHRLETLYQNKIGIVKEFIDFSPTKGKAYLEDFLRGKMNCFEFQCFVLDCYNQQLKVLCSTKSIVVLERGPFDSVGVFTKQSLVDGGITQDGYDRLMQKVRELETQYGIPSSSHLKIERKDMATLDEESVFNSIKNNIFKTVENSSDLLVYLYSSNPQKQLQNIAKRGRPEERNYNIDYMLKINQAYADLFSA
ncbi:deoxyguanosine kinase, putative [Entamoeba invadens IP1]|uniref:deoxyguanosine kinase, putative n=1 Tax=Entamoeba invadens IP1 TaxID=370355 RepID=UPI0002C3E0E3|nr:deoxyguanosine kinase, putative [Entamoeba invadens IP1]ELP90394.1 deoxyguanosine kinase, putative [Entamoeba invadens IP1]|eukprot:XP_004257165.1 deoxyguanosine kinase, putative [Entamoeba invadens IP1]